MLQSIFRLAVKLDMLTVNPAKAEKLTLPKKVAPKIEIFTKAEAAEMLKCLQTEPLAFQTFIQRAIFTGARRGELVALKFSDFDYVKGQVTISRAVIKVDGSGLSDQTAEGLRGQDGDGQSVLHRISKTITDSAGA